jgi:acyl-CoA synthetase (AMP-forming)/AMP-acid ligase II
VVSTDVVSPDVVSPGGVVDRVEDLLSAAVAARPDARAVSDPDGSWTYADLDTACRSWTEWLRRNGVEAGDRVVLRMRNCRDLAAVVFAVLRRGAVVVPLSTATRPFQLAHVLRTTAPRVVLAHDGDADHVRDLVPGIPVHDVDRGPHSAPTPVASRARSREDGPAPAFLVHTSGSTAMPKGVVSPHAAVLFVTRAIAHRLRYRGDDVVLGTVPASFDYGLYQLLLSVHATAELAFADPSPVRLLAEVHRTGATVLPLVPSAGQLLVRLAGRDPREPNAVRMVTSTGEALPPALVRELSRVLPRATVVPMYGTTECKRICVDDPLDPSPVGSVGRALPGTVVEVVDESGVPLPPGTQGEIVVRGPHVMAGYWRSPQATVQRFRCGTVGVVLHTGDLGHVDDAGNVYVSGRRDGVFKRHGVRTSAAEVEAAARDVPGVAAAAVLPPDETHDAAVFALRRPGERLDDDSLRAGLAARLEPAKVPPSCHVVEEFPLTAHGKTDLARLAAGLRRPTPQDTGPDGKPLHTDPLTRDHRGDHRDAARPDPARPDAAAGPSHRSDAA